MRPFLWLNQRQPPLVNQSPHDMVLESLAHKASCLATILSLSTHTPELWEKGRSLQLILECQFPVTLLLVCGGRCHQSRWRERETCKFVRANWRRSHCCRLFALAIGGPVNHARPVVASLLCPGCFQVISRLMDGVRDKSTVWTKRRNCFVWFFFVSFDWMSFMFDFYLVLLSHHIIFFLCLVFGWDSITVHCSSSSGVSVHQEVFLDGPIMRKLFLHEHTMRTSSMNLWHETSRT